MNFFQKTWRSNLLIKVRSWEYWPFEVVYAPIFAYWIWLSLKARSLFFFSASNPSIENGGMLGESKIKILDLIPSSIKPATLYFHNDVAPDVVLSRLEKEKLNFPIICKPDIGERGWFVQKIKSAGDLAAYIHKCPVAFLVQEFLSEPIEMGVFYYRYPSQKEGKVTSIVIKEMLQVTGDGHSTLKELILRSDRAKLQWNTLKRQYNGQLSRVLDKGQRKELVSIGNHCLGTKFMNGNRLINDRLHRVFDRISTSIPGFYFGRFDLRVATIENLYEGNIKIMELNGAGSEPAHIYDPGFSFFKGLKVLFHHWKVLYEISVENHERGVPYLSFRQGRAEYAKVRALNKLK